MRSVLIEKYVKKFNLHPLKIVAYEGYININNNHIFILLYIICRNVWSFDSLRSHVANVLHNNTQRRNSRRNISGPKWEVANLCIFNFVLTNGCCAYPINRMEDAIDGFKMIFDGKQSWLLGWTVVNMISIAFYNYAGQYKI